MYGRKDVTFLKLVSQMLEPNPDNRIDYKGILSHEFFRQRSSIDRYPEFINTMPKIENINSVFTDVLSVPDGKKIRGILYGWAFKLCGNFRYCPNTVCLAVQLTDLYISYQKKYPKAKVQQLLCVCINTASKLFEFKVRSYEVYAYYSDQGDEYVQECINLEKQILDTLDGNILIPTVYSYWSRKKGNMPLEDTKILFTDIYLRDDIYNNSLDIMD